jgi:hypothetical protein
MKTNKLVAPVHALEGRSNMRVQTFIGKVSSESLRIMDEQINQWLRKNQVEPKLVNQSFGYECHRLHEGQEPVIVTSVWY